VLWWNKKLSSTYLTLIFHLVMSKTIKWEGQSGEMYKYWILPIDASLKEEPGNYIFAKQTQDGSWRPVYIGQTSNLDGRLSDHNEEKCAQRNGATHVHAHTSSSKEKVRRSEESDLIRRFQPVCND
jgi:hypothetical protein